jgi:hypothetical protein
VCSPDEQQSFIASVLLSALAIFLITSLYVVALREAPVPKDKLSLDEELQLEPRLIPSRELRSRPNFIFNTKIALSVTGTQRFFKLITNRFFSVFLIAVHPNRRGSNVDRCTVSFAVPRLGFLSAVRTDRHCAFSEHFGTVYWVVLAMHFDAN